MTENGHTPEPAERGRYALYTEPSGGLVIARAANICDTCSACGCGEQCDPITIPAALVAMARAAAEGKMKLPTVKQLKQLAGNRGPSGRH